MGQIQSWFEGRCRFRELGFSKKIGQGIPGICDGCDTRVLDIEGGHRVGLFRDGLSLARRREASLDDGKRRIGPVAQACGV